MARFKDVDAGHWAAGVIEQVAALGLMVGGPDGRFRPDEPLTRAEAAAILVRLAKRLGWQIPAPPPGQQAAPAHPPLPPLPSQPVGAAVKPWLPVDAPIRSTRADRRPELLDLVIRQFRVATNPRYRANQQGKGETYCNIFLWDVTRALGCEIPHWVDQDGDPTDPGKGRELSANGVVDWLRQHGSAYGWRRASAAEAQAAANAGRPAVVVWQNPGGIGHVAVVHPGGPAPDGQPLISQAGAVNFERRLLSAGFGNKGPVEFWVHD